MGTEKDKLVTITITSDVHKKVLALKTIKGARNMSETIDYAINNLKRRQRKLIMKVVEEMGKE